MHLIHLHWSHLPVLLHSSTLKNIIRQDLIVASGKIGIKFMACLHNCFGNPNYPVNNTIVYNKNSVFNSFNPQVFHKHLQNFIYFSPLYEPSLVSYTKPPILQIPDVFDHFCFLTSLYFSCVLTHNTSTHNIF